MIFKSKSVLLNKKTFKINRFFNTFYSLLFCLIGTIVTRQNSNLKVVGDNEHGFNVDIYNGKHLIVKNTEAFSVAMVNVDISEKAKIYAWKGPKRTGDTNSLQLTRASSTRDLC